MRWFAVRVKSRHEKAVACNLQVKEFVSFTPLYSAVHHWTDRERTVHLPLFPGYVFCRFATESLASILRTPGVIDVVRIGNFLAPIDDGEIQALQQVMNSGCQAEPAPYIEVDQRVTITSGPLTGLGGTVIRHKSAMKLVLSVTLLQRSVQVEVSPNSLMVEHENPLQRRGVAGAFVPRMESALSAAGGK